jgi:hypothetical protein
MGLLDRVGGQQGKSGLADGHDVLVVAENGEGMGGDGAGGDMQHAGQQLAGHLVHVGDHQQQALGGGEGAGQRTGRQRAVDGGGGTGFALKLSDQQCLAENFCARGRPFVTDLADGEDGVMG